MLKVANNILDLIGETPLLKIRKLTRKNEAEIYVKLEWYNIGGSLKDRMALYLIKKAEKEGRLTKEKTILEATGGNTGIALAMIGAFKGYKVEVVIPESVPLEIKKIIKAYGGKLIFSSAEKGVGGARELKQKILKENPGKYVDIDQSKDPANVLSHYETTAKEILEQTGGKIDMIIVPIGTAGTGMGVSMRVKEYNPKIKIIGVTSKLGVRIQGLRNPNEPYATQLLKKEYFDEIIEIKEEEKPRIFKTIRRVARKEGLLIGISSGAIMYVALKKAREIGQGKIIIGILPDNGLKYLSTNLFI